MAAADDVSGGRNHAVSALAAAQFRVFLDAIDRHFRGAAEYREHRTILEEVDGIIAPFAVGDLAAVKPQNTIKLTPAESDLGCGGGRTSLAPAPRAWIGFAEIHRRLLKLCPKLCPKLRPSVTP